MADVLPITGFEDLPIVQDRVPTADVLRAESPETWADLFRVFHPPARSVPMLRQGDTGTGAKPLPTGTVWERWVSQPFSNAVAGLGSILTAPLRFVKTTGLWLGGGLVVVLIAAVVGLVVVLRIVRTVEG